MRIPIRIGVVLAALLCVVPTAVHPAAAGVRIEPIPHPSLSGKRIQAPGGVAIYLVDPDGYRRWIPDPTTYDNLFRDWEGVVPAPHLDLIAERAPLTSGAFLAVAPGRPQVYLVSNDLRHWIVSPAAMDKYHFSWKTIKEIPASVLDKVLEGPSWG